MAKKIEKESYEKISGGVAWSEEEELYLMGLLCGINYGTRYFQDFEWEEAVEGLNNMYGNNRSISACKQRVTWQKIQEAYRQKKI